MAASYIRSWGIAKPHPVDIKIPAFFADLPVRLPQQDQLVFGQGRSYGDVCLPEGPNLWQTSLLDRVIHFDHTTGRLQAQAGIRLDSILDFVVPQGWFLPVTPGTKYVSLGGAIANDIHGKNHHTAGTFGCFVRKLRLLRSDHGLVECGPNHEVELFRATIGGLGLTGFIVEAEVQLQPIHSAAIDSETLAFHSLEEFFEINAASTPQWPYTVSWLDCLSGGRHFGRGIYFRGRHSEAPIHTPAGKLNLSMPFPLPSWTLNSFSLNMFNRTYFHLQRIKQGKHRLHFDPFFYPLDHIGAWNRVYGASGFFQHQCCLPADRVRTTSKTLLRKIIDSGYGSALSVFKTFGEIQSPGMLSFPTTGVTLALDFPNRGPKTIEFLRQLDAFVIEHGGRVYPAKDAWMLPTTFRSSFPKWQEFLKLKDPYCNSAFWRRVHPERG